MASINTGSTTSLPPKATGQPYSGALGTEHILGIGTLNDGEQQRMPILMAIDKLMSSADMGLIAGTASTH